MRVERLSQQYTHKPTNPQPTTHNPQLTKACFFCFGTFLVINPLSFSIVAQAILYLFISCFQNFRTCYSTSLIVIHTPKALVLLGFSHFLIFHQRIGDSSANSYFELNLGIWVLGKFECVKSSNFLGFSECCMLGEY